ncbi:hypothetical protein KKF61_06330 [Patescibacteria group bacterium]|nr:hypothetical protein [Patescibacteria group bacterium]MBU0964511.1 hypothetical protein [Patescibacteria group bacterium]
MPQEFTPEQQQRVKRAKHILWIGIVGIVVIGLAVAVYFMFVQGGSKSDTNINVNINVNTSIDNSDWLLYENEPYGFSFRYPADWMLEDFQDPILSANFEIANLKPADNVLVTFSWIGNNPDRLSVDEWLVQNQQKQYGDEYNINTDDILSMDLADLSPSLYQGVISINFTHDDDVIEVEWFDGDKKHNQEFKEFQQLILSLEFTDITATDSSSWQTYEDALNGYSIKYPADYLIKMQTDNYVVFDSTDIDSPDTSYLNVSVNAENGDFHTSRLSILTDRSVDTDTPMDEVDTTISGLSGKKITLKNVLGETIIHYLVAYLGKVYDISAGDSVEATVLNSIISSFEINQLSDEIDISDTEYFSDKECVGNNDCGAFPCLDGICLVQRCAEDSECAAGTCGQYITPVPGYCTTMDSL